MSGIADVISENSRLRNENADLSDALEEARETNAGLLKALKDVLDSLEGIAAEGVVRIYARDKKRMDKASAAIAKATAKGK